MIVFYDGVCGFCDRSVQFVLARDKRRRFRFAPLQGKTAAAALDEASRRDLDSVVVKDGDRLYKKSAAALKVLVGLGGAWRLAAAFWLVPRPVRDWAYDLVARRRYRLFGTLPTCRLPSPDERAAFLE